MVNSSSSISPLRKRMIDDMTMRRLSDKTQTSFFSAITCSRSHGRCRNRTGGTVSVYPRTRRVDRRIPKAHLTVS